MSNRGGKRENAGRPGLVDAETRQADLFGLAPKGYTSQALMNVVDSINNRMGQGTVRLASEGFIKTWSMRREKKSRNYTTDWEELVCVE